MPTCTTKEDKLAYDIAYDWYFRYQYIDLDKLGQKKRDALLSNLLAALSVLLVPYENCKAKISQNHYVDDILAWFCSTYGWYYYSYQHDRIEKFHKQQLEAGKEPVPFNLVVYGKTFPDSEE